MKLRLSGSQIHFPFTQETWICEIRNQVFSLAQYKKDSPRVNSLFFSS